MYKLDQTWIPFSNLMLKHIYNVLLICSDYDRFMLEEDGRVEEELYKEYMGLGLSTPPKITHTSDPDEAIRLIEESFQTNDEGVLFVMDIDDFKMLNDTCGHLVGDQVLMGFADILRKNSRSDDVCARLGGDEFLVYFPGLERKETAAERADLIRRQFQQMNGGKFGDVQLSVSIGIAVRQKEESFDHLYGAADQALYQAKRKKKGLYLFSEGAD